MLFACLPCLSCLSPPQIVGSTSGVASALSGLTQLSLSCRLELAALAPDFLESLSQVCLLLSCQSLPTSRCQPVACCFCFCWLLLPLPPIPALLPLTLLSKLSLQLRRLELGTVRLAQFTPRLAQALGHLTYLACAGT